MLGDGAYLNIDRDVDSFNVQIGKWNVRLSEGVLSVVESDYRVYDPHVQPLVKVPA
jgi:hypothetical protein